MRRSISTLATVLLVGFAAGCHSVDTTDVSDDPRFQGGYAVGQDWTLLKPACLVSHVPGFSQSDDPERVIWSVEVARRAATQGTDGAGQATSIVARVPAGSHLRIRRLRYSKDVDRSIWVYPQRLVELSAEGTLTTPDGTWQDVIAPATFDTDTAANRVRSVDGVSLTVPNLELVGPTPMSR